MGNQLTTAPDLQPYLDGTITLTPVTADASVQGQLTTLAKSGLKVLQITSNAAGVTAKWLFRFGGALGITYTVLDSELGSRIIVEVLAGKPVDDIIADITDDYAVGPALSFGCAVGLLESGQALTPEGLNQCVNSLAGGNLGNDADWIENNCQSITDHNRRICAEIETSLGWD